jgi:HEAT repeat protein
MSSTTNAILTVSALVERLDDPDPVVRVHAAMVLGSLGEGAQEAVPALVKLLREGEVQDRRVAALALGEVGPAAEEAVQALLEATGDEDEGVSKLAMRALEGIDLATATRDAA